MSLTVRAKKWYWSKTNYSRNPIANFHGINKIMPPFKEPECNLHDKNPCSSCPHLCSSNNLNQPSHNYSGKICVELGIFVVSVYRVWNQEQLLKKPRLLNLWFCIEQSTFFFYHLLVGITGISEDPTWWGWNSFMWK